MSVVSRRPSRALTTALALLALGAAGCGGDPVAGPGSTAVAESSAPPNGERAWAEKGIPAVRAFHAAPSMRMDLVAERSSGDVRATIRAARTGECLLDLKIGSARSSQTLRTSDGVMYMKISEAQIRAAVAHKGPERTEAEVRLFADRWLQGDPVSPTVRQAHGLCDFRNRIPTDPGDPRTAPVPVTTTENGRELLVYRMRDSGTDIDIEMQVTTGPEPVLHRFRLSGPDAATLTFSEYGKPVRAERPPARDVLTTEQAKALYEAAPDGR
ncbi:hypothetical protein ACWDR0_00205 [Streptomyces sp. NPDC003691]